MPFYQLIDRLDFRISGIIDGTATADDHIENAKEIAKNFGVKVSDETVDA